jgi:hypothetical protein
MTPTYAAGSPFTYFYYLAMGVALVVLVLTVHAALSSKTPRRTLWHLVFFWTVMPPAWFAIEYFILYGHYGVPGSFESFKYGQEVAAKFWAGGLALVVAKLFQDKEAAQPRR